MKINRDEIYAKTKEFLAERFWSIMIICLLIAVIEYGIDSIGGNGIVGKIGNILDELSKGNYIEVETLINANANSNIIVVYLRVLVVTILNVGLSISILGAYRKNEKVSISEGINAIKENFSKFIVAIIIITVSTTLISYIPPIGGVLAWIVEYSLAFSYFLIKDGKSPDALSSIKDSYEQTTGHKLNFFLIDLHYFLRVLICISVVIIGSIIATPDMPSSGVVVMLLGIGTFFVLFIRYMIYSQTAMVIYYETLNEESNNDA